MRYTKKYRWAKFRGYWLRQRCWHQPPNENYHYQDEAFRQDAYFVSTQGGLPVHFVKQ
ncbi:MAG: hypothetical protein IPM82_14595 [Saprospiraceae bacterium]|nr:hypothetical protein [Saprospiraceae bacterium]